MSKLFEIVKDERSRIMDEYESGAEYTRDEYNFDDGYISALDWVMEQIEKITEDELAELGEQIVKACEPYLREE